MASKILKNKSAMLKRHGGIGMGPIEFYYLDVKKLYKSFGSVQSWVGGIGIHASLKNWMSYRDYVGSSPAPSALTTWNIK